MTSLGSEVAAAFFSAAAAIILFLAAHKKGFFNGWRGIERSHAPPTFLLTIGAFIIYFLLGILIPALINKVQTPITEIGSTEIATLINCLTGASIIAALFLYMQSIYKPIAQSIWNSSSEKKFSNDLMIALSACFVSYPLVICVGQILEILIYLIFNTLQIPDQSVILFLKTTFDKPLYFFLATCSIIIFAPLIEELLFRGFLQSYLRRYFNAPVAIILSSSSFAMFHYSKDQGLGNIPIIGSLFVLANFLGFVYERQGSLLSPMILHSIFNILSIANLYFLGT